MASLKTERNDLDLKVLQIAPEYPPHNIGGGGKVVQDISRRLHEKGWLAGILAGYYPTHSIFDRIPPLRDRSKKGEFEVEWLPLVPTDSFSLRTVLPPNPIASVALIGRLFKRDYDIVHLHGYGTISVSAAAVACRLMRRRYVLTLHGFPRSPQEEGGANGFFFKLYSRTLGSLTLTGAVRITAISKVVMEEAVKYGAREDRIVLIPNGIDLDAADPVPGTDIRDHFGLGERSRLIICLGICHERKGFQHVISAMPEILRHHPDVGLAIVGGDGGYRKALEDLASELGVRDRVIFTGFVNGPEKVQIIDEAEVFVIPSLVEPFGLVALEAMSREKAIVASRVDGLAEVLEDGITALMFDPGDVASMAKSICSLLENKERARELSENAITAVSRYDWSKVMEEFYAVYRAGYGERRKR